MGSHLLSWVHSEDSQMLLAAGCQQLTGLAQQLHLLLQGAARGSTQHDVLPAVLHQKQHRMTLAAMSLHMQP